MNVYNMRVTYEDGHSRLIAQGVEANDLETAKAMAERKVKMLNSDMVSSIIGKVVAYEIYEGKVVYKHEVVPNSRSAQE